MEPSISLTLEVPLAAAMGVVAAAIGVAPLWPPSPTPRRIIGRMRVDELEAGKDYVYRRARSKHAFGSPMYRVTYLGQERRSGKARVRFPAGQATPWSRDGALAPEPVEEGVILGQLVCSWDEEAELRAEEEAIAALAEGSERRAGDEDLVLAEATDLVFQFAGLPRRREVLGDVIALEDREFEQLRQLAGEQAECPEETSIHHGRAGRIFMRWSTAAQLAEQVAAANAEELRPEVRMWAEGWVASGASRHGDRVGEIAELVEDWCGRLVDAHRDAGELRAAVAALARTVEGLDRGEEDAKEKVAAVVAWAEELIASPPRRFEVQLWPPPPGGRSTRRAAVTPAELADCARAVLREAGPRAAGELVFQAVLVDAEEHEAHRELNPWESEQLRAALAETRV